MTSRPPPYAETKGYYPPAPAVGYPQYPAPSQPMMYQPPPPQAYPTAPPSGYQAVPMGPPAPAGAYYPQQQQVVVAPATVVVGARTVPSFAGHIIFSCFVFWCCGCLFGLIAFILAMWAYRRAPVDANSARQLGYASIGVSVAGIVIAVIVIIVLIPLVIMGAVFHHTQSIFDDMDCRYKVDGMCFRYRVPTFSGSCLDKDDYLSDGYCYSKHL